MAAPEMREVPGGGGDLTRAWVLSTGIGICFARKAPTYAHAHGAFCGRMRVALDVAQCPRAARAGRLRTQVPLLTSRARTRLRTKRHL